MSGNGNGNGNGNGGGHVDKALREFALDCVRVDLIRLREFAEDKAKDHPEWAMVESLVDSITRHSAIAFELSGDDLRGLPLAKRSAPSGEPEGWLEKVTRRLPGVEENRALIHATRGFRLACDPSKIHWGNTIGKHMLGCGTCRAAHEAGRIKEGGEVQAPEPVAPSSTGAPKPESAGRPARVLRGGKGRRGKAKAATRGGKRKVAV